MWILTGGDHQMQRWRQVLEQEGEGMVNWFGIHNMVVVQDEHEMVRDGIDFIEQGRQRRFDCRRLMGLKRSQHTCADIRRDRLQSRDQVSQKAVGVVIAFIQRQPGGAKLWFESLSTGEPFADQRGFPKAGRGRDQGQFAMQALHSSARSGADEGRILVEWGGYKAWC